MSVLFKICLLLFFDRCYPHLNPFFGINCTKQESQKLSIFEGGEGVEEHYCSYHVYFNNPNKFHPGYS